MTRVPLKTNGSMTRATTIPSDAEDPANSRNFSIESMAKFKLQL
jgi:hypothetical protein